MIDTPSSAPEGGALTVPVPAPKILFAEDEEDLRELIGTILLEEGYQIQAAHDGREAVSMFAEFQPDLVILDMHMPVMNGTDACSIIRQNSDIPIIMFTAANDVNNVNGAISQGTTDFVLKGTGITELAERVASHLPKKNNPVHKPAESPVVQGSAFSLAPFTSTTLIVDPDEQNRSLIASILTGLSQNFIEVDTGSAAVSAIEQHDPDILITEWSLPDMDAFNMLSELTRGQSAKGASQVYKLMMSAHISPEARRKAEFIGIANFLYKPLDRANAEIMLADSVNLVLRNLRRNASRAA